MTYIRDYVINGMHVISYVPSLPNQYHLFAPINTTVVSWLV